MLDTGLGLLKYTIAFDLRVVPILQLGNRKPDMYWIGTQEIKLGDKAADEANSIRIVTGTAAWGQGTLPAIFALSRWEAGRKICKKCKPQCSYWVEPVVRLEEAESQGCRQG